MLLRLAQFRRKAAEAYYRAALANSRGLNVRRRAARAKRGAGYTTRVWGAVVPRLKLHMGLLCSTPFGA